MNMNYYLHLFKREMLQHKGAFVYTPIVLFGLVLIGAIFSASMMVNEAGVNVNMNLNDAHWNGMDKWDGPENFQPIYGFLFIGAIVGVFYLLDSLYSDRKDRSILFWRSLPVSEFTNVIVKLLTAVVLIPSIFFVAGLVSSLVAVVILYIGATIMGIEVDNAVQIISYVSGIKTALPTLFSVLFTGILMIPMYLLLLTASSAARRSPWLTLIGPIGGITIFELIALDGPKTVVYLFKYIGGVTTASYELFNNGVWTLGIVQILGAVAVAAGLYIAVVYLRLRRFEI